jgi:FkbM family methyltransferase
MTSPASDLIFDVGMHTAEDTSYYLAKGYRVIAIEAMQSLCDTAADRFAAEVASGQLTIVNAAITAKPGPVTFYANAHTAWGTTHEAWADRNTKMGSAPTSRITVPGRDFRSILLEYGIPHMLKIDIEGADLLCLEGLQTLQGRPDFISIESDKRHWQGLMREFTLLDQLGYKRFKIVDQKLVPTQKTPTRSSEGGSVEPWSFEIGASGMFGNDLPGEWLSKQQAIRQYLPIFFRYLVYGEEAPLRWRPNNAARVGYKLLRTAFGEVSWYDTHAAR